VVRDPLGLEPGPEAVFEVERVPDVCHVIAIALERAAHAVEREARSATRSGVPFVWPWTVTNA
jgi:hypothetical protein